MDEIKLYIWNQPYQVSYGSSIAYVLARSEDEARNELRAAHVSQYGYRHEEKTTNCYLDKKPDRILSAPFCEIYEWSE